MPALRLKDREVETDDDGFLQRWEDWDREAAICLARLEAVPDMTDKHWQVVEYMRECFGRSGRAPRILKLCEELQLRFSQLYELFPTGPVKGCCRIAGLPRRAGRV